MERENIDEALRKIDELMECWNNRISIENLAFAKRYLKGEIEVGLVLVTVASPSTVSDKFVAIFKRNFAVCCLRKVPGRRREVIHSRTDQIVTNSEMTVSSGDGNQQQMFIGDIDTVETIEGIVPSVVRLESFDQFDRRCAGTVDPLDGARSEIRCDEPTGNAQ